MTHKKAPNEPNASETSKTSKIASSVWGLGILKALEALKAVEVFGATEIQRSRGFKRFRIGAKKASKGRPWLDLVPFFDYFGVQKADLD